MARPKKSEEKTKEPEVAQISRDDFIRTRDSVSCPFVVPLMFLKSSPGHPLCLQSIVASLRNHHNTCSSRKMLHNSDVPPPLPLPVTDVLNWSREQRDNIPEDSDQ